MRKIFVKKLSKNYLHLKYLFHCINFNAFARKAYSSIKDKKIKKAKLSFIIMSEDMLPKYMKILSKKKKLNKTELKSLMNIYNFLRTIYNHDFKAQIKGKKFSTEFDYSP